MIRLLVLLLISVNVSAKTKQDWFFNPNCDVKKLWAAKDKQIEIPEMTYCHIWKHPDGMWRPRIMPKDSQDYVETEADKKARADLKPLTKEQIDYLGKNYYHE